VGCQRPSFVLGVPLIVIAAELARRAGASTDRGARGFEPSGRITRHALPSPKAVRDDQAPFILDPAAASQRPERRLFAPMPNPEPPSARLRRKPFVGPPPRRIMWLLFFGCICSPMIAMIDYGLTLSLFVLPWPRETPPYDLEQRRSPLALTGRRAW
jgi:hypothetical protein